MKRVLTRLLLFCVVLTMVFSVCPVKIQSFAVSTDELGNYVRGLIGSSAKEWGSGSGTQCVELPKFYLDDYFGLSTKDIALGNGNAIYKNVAARYPDLFQQIDYYNGFTPLPGDIISFHSGTSTGKPYGHAAIVYAVSGNQYSIAEQWKGSGTVRSNTKTVTGPVYGVSYTIIGVARPKANRTGSWDIRNTDTYPSFPGNLKTGSKGYNSVGFLQTALNDLGYNCGTVDSIFGSNTQTAVISFQRDNGLSQDGIVGQQTWSMLLEKLRQKYGLKAPARSSISIEEEMLPVGGSITFTVDSDTAKAYTIGIDKDNTRILTKDIPTTFTYTCDSEGSYSAYVTAYNDAGYKDSATVSWTVSNKLYGTSPSDLGSSFYANIKNIKLDKYITNVSTGSSENSVAGKSKTGALDQVWLFQKVQGNAYKIVSVKNNWVWDVHSHQFSNNTPLEIYSEYNGRTHQLFFIYKKYGGYYIRPLHTAKCIDMSSSDYAVSIWQPGDYQWSPQEFDIIKLNDHTWTWVTDKNATCTAAGTKHQYCSVCGKTQSYNTSIPASGHSYGVWTKMNDTAHKRVCARCGVSETQNHNWNAGTVTKAATCAAAGVKTYTCTICNATRTEPIAKTTNHVWNAGSVTKAATCAAAGVKTYTCTICNATRTETIAKTTNHVWNAGSVTKAATCAAAGVKTYTCTICNATRTETIAKTTNHVWNAGSVTKAATCAAAGVKTYTCTVCGLQREEAVYLPLSFTAHPKDIAAAVQSKVTVSAAAKGTGVTYKWRCRTSKDGAWMNCTAAGSDTAQITFTAKEADNGRQYQCVITDVAGNKRYSAIATLTVQALGFTAHPKNTAAAPEGAVSFSVGTTGVGVTYRWRYRTSKDCAWVNCTDAGSDTSQITFTAKEADNGRQYQCVITDAAGNKRYSAIATLTVQALGFTAHPKNMAAAPESKTSFSVGATGVGVTYRWRYRTSKDGAWVYSTEAGSDTAQITFTATEADNGRQYQCVITDAAGNKRYSAIATLTVKALAITAQPKNVTAAPEGKASFSVGATGVGVTYRWRYRTSKDGAWVNSTDAGSNTNTITFTAKAAYNGRQYQCVVTDAGGNVRYSGVGTLTVK